MGLSACGYLFLVEDGGEEVELECRRPCSFNVDSCTVMPLRAISLISKVKLSKENDPPLMRGLVSVRLMYTDVNVRLVISLG